jgi:hypothetical protein
LALDFSFASRRDARDARGFDCFFTFAFCLCLSAGVDWPAFCGDGFFVVALNDAYTKLAGLSDERARRVVELIEDLAELEAREEAEDLAAARAALADGEAAVPWEQVKTELDAVHGIH